MRQLVDLTVWVGMIVVAMGVVYFTPIVADYLTSDSRLSVVEVASRHRQPPTLSVPPRFEGPASHN